MVLKNKLCLYLLYQQKLLKNNSFLTTDNQLLKKYFENNLKIFTTMYCIVLLFLYIFA